MRRALKFRVTDFEALEEIKDDFEAVRLAMLNGKILYSCMRLRAMKPKGLTDILNQQYLIEDDQVMTLFIESSLKKEIEFMRELLDVYHVDINSTGTVYTFFTLVEGATALWAAAADCNSNILQFLIDNGASVDLCTKTKSSPLRAACFAGGLNCVHILVEHGANVNLTNMYNSTCLMIATYNGYKEIVKYLLRKGADANAQTNCGSTAMHFAAQSNDLQIIKVLISGGANHLPNNRSITPLLVAAERLYIEIVNYLIDVLIHTAEQLIDAYELIGASYLSDKRSYNVDLGLSYLMRGMRMREMSVQKQPLKAIDAYNNQIECTTIEALSNLKDNTDGLHYEALIVRERILGENNPDLLQSIVFRGACYADALQFTSCLKLWFRSIEISQHNNYSISEDILRFAQLFSQMFKKNINIEMSYFKYVLSAAINEIKSNQHELSEKIDNQSNTEKKLYGNMVSTLGLIIIISETLEKQSNLEQPLRKDLINLIVELVKMDPRTNKGRSLLHMALNFSTCVDRIFTVGVYSFPHYISMKLLIYCGADVNVMDCYRSTPLHYIGRYIRCFPDMPHTSDEFETKKIIVALLISGAHTDIVNYSGECPRVGYLKNMFDLINSPRNLKCLAAIALKYCSPYKNYSDHLPQALIDFTNLH